MSENNRKNGASSSSEWFDAAIVDEKPSRLSGTVFILLCAVPIFSAVAYGAVDNWSLGILAIFASIIIIFWIADAWQKKEFRFSSSTLQLPVIGLVLIGIIQLLPLRSANVSADLLSVPAVSSLSLDPYPTRFALILLIIYFIFFAAALCYINDQKRIRRKGFGNYNFRLDNGVFRHNPAACQSRIDLRLTPDPAGNSVCVIRQSASFRRVYGNDDRLGARTAFRKSDEKRIKICF